jgi:hypothetical protein
MAVSLESCTKALTLVDLQALCDEAEKQGGIIYQQTILEADLIYHDGLVKVERLKFFSGWSQLYHSRRRGKWKISPKSTVSEDQGTKRGLYAFWGVPKYFSV